MENTTFELDKSLLAINPETGEFDISVLPFEEQQRIRKMAAQMIVKEPFPKSCTLRKKKHKVKQPKTFGKQKKKKK
jgi:hypothetical protein